MWNAAFNPLSVLSGGLDTLTLLDHAESLVREIMREVTKIAEAQGHILPPNLIDDQIEKTRSASAYKTSMLLDFEAGRPMETQAILGTTVRIAKESVVAVPHLETILSLLNLITLIDRKPRRNNN